MDGASEVVQGVPIMGWRTKMTYIQHAFFKWLDHKKFCSDDEDDVCQTIDHDQTLPMISGRVAGGPSLSHLSKWDRNNMSLLIPGLRNPISIL